MKQLKNLIALFVIVLIPFGLKRPRVKKTQAESKIAWGCQTKNLFTTLYILGLQAGEGGHKKSK